MRPYGTRADRDCGRRLRPGYRCKPRAYGALGDRGPDKRERRRARRLAREQIAAALVDYFRDA